MNGHSALILFSGLAGVVGLAFPAGANPNHVILILLGLLGGLVAVLWRMAKELTRQRVILFGEEGVGGLWRTVTHPKYGLVRGQQDHNVALAFLLQQGSQVIRAVAEASSYEEARMRMRGQLSQGQSEIADLRDRIRALDLSPFVKAD